MIILSFSVEAKWCVMPALWLLHHPRQTGLMFPAAPPTHLSSPALKHWPLKFLPGSQMEKSRLVTGASYLRLTQSVSLLLVVGSFLSLSTSCAKVLFSPLHLLQQTKPCPETPPLSPGMVGWKGAAPWLQDKLPDAIHW